MPDDEYLRHISESARLALQYVAGMSLEAFLASTLVQDAVLHRLSIIGEAGKWVSAEAKRAMPDIDWRRLIGMRNFVVHEYWSVDLTITWDTLHRDLPRLIASIERYRS